MLVAGGNSPAIHERKVQLVYSMQVMVVSLASVAQNRIIMLTFFLQAEIYFLAHASLTRISQRVQHLHKLGVVASIDEGRVLTLALRRLY